jgi:cytochrome c oxidase subunit 1
MMGSINYMTTIIQMRAPGMTMFRLPMTIWAMFITAILQAFALPVLTAAGFIQLTDRMIGTGFLLPEYLVVNNSEPASGGGQPLLWQHLFWFYSHPAVYIMILPAMGMVSDMISCFARKPLFGYKPMVYSIAGIAGLGFIVWGHHMFVSGMNPALGMTFMVSTMLIALPSAIKVFNWLGTIWGGNLQFTTPMLFALSFVSMFIIGGLSGIFMAATPVDIFIHDTYFIVAHFHYVLFSGTAMAVFGAIYFWFPKMFGRMMNDSWGKVHFFLTFVLLNCVFFPMHILGAVGFPRRLADPYHYATFRELGPLNEFITYCALALVAVQAIFVVNFFVSMFFGPKAGRNPWHANGLEWAAPSPPGHGNFDFQPLIYRGPYEYGDPSVDTDYYPQTQPPPAGHPETSPGTAPATH